MHTQPDIHVPQAPAIKVYEAILTQTGTAAPVPTVLKNTLGEEITWTRNNQGVTDGNTTNNIFKQDKTTYFITNNFYVSNGYIPIWFNNPTEENSIRFDMYDKDLITKLDGYQVYIQINVHQ